jgi:hypothetical protein
MLSCALTQFENFMIDLNSLGKTAEDSDIRPWADLARQSATEYYNRMNGTDTHVITLCMFLYLYYIRLALTYSLQFLILQNLFGRFLNIGAKMIPTRRRGLY